MKRKLLSKTQREIVLSKDKCRKCRNLLEQSRIYPFSVYCGWCHIDIKYEDQIIFHKKSKIDKFVEKLVSKMDKDKRAILLNEYNRLKE